MQARFAGSFVVVLMLTVASVGAGAKSICPAHVVPEHGARLKEPAFKGVELYSWQADGVFRFSLLWGTNRYKTEQEIKTANCALANVDELKAALNRLAPGESVFWFNVAPSAELAYPPADVIEEVRQYTQLVQLHLVLPLGHGN